jgi:hypothetical protein
MCPRKRQALCGSQRVLGAFRDLGYGSESSCPERSRRGWFASLPLVRARHAPERVGSIESSWPRSSRIVRMSCPAVIRCLRFHVRNQAWTRPRLSLSRRPPHERAARPLPRARAWTRSSDQAHGLDLWPWPSRPSGGTSRPWA